MLRERRVEPPIPIFIRILEGEASRVEEGGEGGDEGMYASIAEALQEASGILDGLRADS